MSAACQFVNKYREVQLKQKMDSVKDAACAQANREETLSSSLRLLRVIDIKTGSVDYENKDSLKQL